MVVKIFCDLCGTLILEEAGSLQLDWGLWGEKATKTYYDYDALCEDCTNSLRRTIETHIGFLKKALRTGIICPFCPPSASTYSDEDFPVHLLKEHKRAYESFEEVLKKIREKEATT